MVRGLQQLFFIYFVNAQSISRLEGTPQLAASRLDLPEISDPTVIVRASKFRQSWRIILDQPGAHVNLLAYILVCSRGSILIATNDHEPLNKRLILGMGLNRDRELNVVKHQLIYLYDTVTSIPGNHASCTAMEPIPACTLICKGCPFGIRGVAPSRCSKSR